MQPRKKSRIKSTRRSPKRSPKNTNPVSSPRESTIRSSVKSKPYIKKGRVKVLKRKPWIEEDYRPRIRSKKNLMGAAIESKSNALYRENIFGSEFVWEHTRFIFPNAKGRKSMKNLFIFAMVKRDALKYLKSHKLPNIDWASSVTYNDDAKARGRRLIGTDIDGAYWQLAHHMGVISENTFNKGLQIKQKHILLASLSSLGRDKRFVVIKDGVFTEDVVIIKGNPDLKNLFKKIRYNCYRYMIQIAKLLGNNFVAYKTDCIYYFKSKKNIRIVQGFLDEKDLDYKMVDDFDSFHDHVED